LVVTAIGIGPATEKNRDVHREIGKLHHGRPGNGAARPDGLLLKASLYADISVVHALDCEPAAGMKELRKLVAQKLRDRIGIHRRSGHRDLPAGRSGALVLDGTVARSTRQVLALHDLRFGLRFDPK
jgi:hypothetical protein